MGRCIYSGGEFVWKYVFAAQSSEQYRIHEELGLGEYNPEVYHSASESGYSEEEIEEGKEEGWISEDGMIKSDTDELTLSTDDIPSLQNYLEKHHYDLLHAEYHNIFKVHGSNPNEGIRLDSPLHDDLNAFCEKNDYYFLRMIKRFIEFMTKKNEETGQTVFTFEGEF